jgi:solute carrier family 25, member 34/35
VANPDVEQAYSPALPVGAQHNYKSSIDALRSIYIKDGPRGLVRGMDAAVLRTAAGSSVQLPSYNWTKTQIVKRGWLPADSTWTFLASSTVSGACVVSVFRRPRNLHSLNNRSLVLGYATLRHRLDAGL